MSPTYAQMVQRKKNTNTHTMIERWIDGRKKEEYKEENYKTNGVNHQKPMNLGKGHMEFPCSVVFSQLFCKFGIV